jgi:MinD superfamily P-loop ATPase
MENAWDLPEVHKERCDACGSCALVCQSGAMILAEQGVKMAHPEVCDGCGVCEDFCPQGAIECAFVIVWGDKDQPGTALPEGGHGD